MVFKTTRLSICRYSRYTKSHLGVNLIELVTQIRVEEGTVVIAMIVRAISFGKQGYNQLYCLLPYRKLPGVSTVALCRFTVYLQKNRRTFPAI